MPTVQLQQWTKDRLAEVRDGESHQSYDSTVKALLRDRRLARQLLSDGSSVRSMTPPLVGDGGGPDGFPLPGTDDDLTLFFGDIGSGKTMTAAYQLHRLLEDDRETTVVALDVLEAYKQFAETHESQTISVGPDTDAKHTLNPLEIHAPSDPEPETAEPTRFDMKLRDVRSFFQIAANRDASRTMLSTILDAAALEAYDRNGITHDPTSHDQQSPTIEDVLTVLSEMAENPAELSPFDGTRTEEVIERSASEVLVALQQFNSDGQFEWFVGQTEFGIADVPFTRIDLSQNSPRDLTLVLQALSTVIMQQAAQRSGRTIVVIDDAVSLITAEPARDTLVRNVRQASANDVGIWAVLQNPTRLDTAGTSSDLVDRADRIYLHCVTGNGDNIRRMFSLSDEQLRLVQTADRGSWNESAEILHRNPKRDWRPYRVEIPDTTLDLIEGH